MLDTPTESEWRAADLVARGNTNQGRKEGEMMHRFTYKLRCAVLGASAAALILVTTTALAGSGLGGVFNLGQTNTVDAMTALSGNAGGSPQLRVMAAGTGAAVRAESATGIGVNGTSSSGTGQFGQSTSGTGMLGVHSATTGAAAGVEGDSSSTDANAHGVIGKIASAGAGSAGVYGVNSSTYGEGYGVFGKKNGGGAGVYGVSPSGLGVLGTSGSGEGVSGISSSGVGVDGSATSGTGVKGKGGIGVYGQSTPANYGVGVMGCAEYCTQFVSGNVGGIFEAAGSQADGIDVQSDSTDGHGAKITSKNIGLTVSGPNDGIQASATATEHSGIYAHHDGVNVGYGVFARSQGGDGVHAYSEGNGKSALFGQWDGGSGSGWAGYFIGNVNISGHLYASAKDFRIDDPVDPAHKYLQHTAVESPDMMDIYNGNVTTDGRGFATVTLPRYFQALNRTFRYQLTSLSGLQNVAIAKEIAHNRFTIQSQRAHSRVSWQVTGIRHDAFANANRTQAEVRKPAVDQGRYIHPELYGKSRRLSEGRVLSGGGHTP